MLELDPAEVAKLNIKPSVAEPSPQDIMRNQTNQMITSLSAARLALYTDYFVIVVNQDNVGNETKQYVRALRELIHASMDDVAMKMYREAKAIDNGQSVKHVRRALNTLRKRIHDADTALDDGGQDYLSPPAVMDDEYYL